MTAAISKLPEYRTTYRLVVDLLVHADTTSQAVFGEAIETLLEWMEPQFPQPVPKERARLEGFEFDEWLDRAYCCSLPEDSHWVVKIILGDEHVDDYVPHHLRGWITNLALRRIDNEVLFGIDVVCVSLPEVQTSVPTFLPKVFRKMAERHCLRDIRILHDEPWRLESGNDLHRLNDLLNSPNRVLPVVVLTQQEDQTSYALDEKTLAREAFGYAHVACLPAKLAKEWPKMICDSWTVPPDSVRIYPSRIDIQSRPGPDQVFFLESGRDMPREELLNDVLWILKKSGCHTRGWERLYGYHEARLYQTERKLKTLQGEINDTFAEYRRQRTLSADEKKHLGKLLVRHRKLTAEAFAALEKYRDELELSANCLLAGHHALLTKTDETPDAPPDAELDQCL